MAVRKIHVWKTKQESRKSRNNLRRKRFGKISNQYRRTISTGLLIEAWRKIFLCFYTICNRLALEIEKDGIVSNLFWSMFTKLSSLAHVRVFQRSLTTTSRFTSVNVDFPSREHDHISWTKSKTFLCQCECGKAKKTPTLPRSPINSCAIDKSCLVKYDDRFGVSLTFHSFLLFVTRKSDESSVEFLKKKISMVQKSIQMDRHKWIEQIEKYFFESRI